MPKPPCKCGRPHAAAVAKGPRERAGASPAAASETLRARVGWTQDVTDPAVLPRLAPFHIWQDSEIEKRFHYEEEKGKQGVSVAFVRIEKLSEPFVFPDSPKFGGCRSWIELPALSAGIGAVPVVEDVIHRAREAEIRAALRG